MRAKLNSDGRDSGWRRWWQLAAQRQLIMDEGVVIDSDNHGATAGRRFARWGIIAAF